MPKITDKESRKKEILLASIETYLNSATPVSSDSLRTKRKLSLSSATVRHVFSELEDMGFLSHPHTSAGRIPTDEGYRLYINVLMKKKKLTPKETEFIDKIYELKVNELDELFEETSRMMSDFTHYTSLVYFSGGDLERTYAQGTRYLFDHPEFSDIHRVQMILEVLEKKEELVDLINRSFSGSTHVYIGKEIDCPRMEHCSVVVSRYEDEKKHSGRLALIGPKRMAYEQVIPFIEYVSEAISRNIERFW
jgi:transcriptional regulator of heat shock response